MYTILLSFLKNDPNNLTEFLTLIINDLMGLTVITLEQPVHEMSFDDLKAVFTQHQPIVFISESEFDFPHGKRLKIAEATQNAGLIALVRGSEHKINIRGPIENCADAYIVKPFDVEKFKTCILKLIDKYSALR